MPLQILDFENVDKLFPADVISRAKEYLAAIPGGTGAYSDSQGAPILREQIAKVCFSTTSALVPFHFDLPKNSCWQEGC